jgi:hypothetical protein
MMHVKNGPDCTCPNDEYHDRAELQTEIERLRAALDEIEHYLNDHSLSAAQIVDRLRVRVGRSKPE